MLYPVEGNVYYYHNYIHKVTQYANAVKNSIVLLTSITLNITFINFVERIILINFI